jgi:hypothetical protein
MNDSRVLAKRERERERRYNRLIQVKRSTIANGLDNESQLLVQYELFVSVSHKEPEEQEEQDKEDDGKGKLFSCTRCLSIGQLVLSLSL